MKKIWIIFVIFYITAVAFGKISKYNLSKIMNEIEHSVVSETKPSENISVLNPLFSTSFLKDYYTNENIRLTKEQIKLESENLGLKLRSSYTYNTNINFISPTLIPYKWDVFIGLYWDILKGGLLENRMKEKDLKETLKVENLLSSLGTKMENEPVLVMAVTYLFNKSIIQSLNNERRFLLFKYKIMKKLYFSHYLKIEDVQNVQNLLEKTNSRLNAYRKYDKNIPEIVKNKIRYFNAASLPIPGLRLKKIYTAIKNPKLKKSIIAYQTASVPEFYDIHITPFAGFYTGAVRTGGGNQNSYSVGISVTIPIPLRTNEDNKIVETEKKLVALNYKIGVRHSINKVTTHYIHYTHNIDTFINLLFLKQETLALLKDDVIKYRFNTPDFSPLNTFSDYETLLDTEVKILRVKELIYLNLIGIQKYIPDPSSITRFIYSLNMERKIPVETKERPGERSIYIWSNEFNNIKNDDLFWLMKTKNIQTVLISIGQKTNKEKLKEFIKMATSGNIKIDALFGEKNIPSKEKIRIIMNDISEYDFSGIHLDIEPYTLPDWKEKTGYYMSLYINMLKEIKQSPYMTGKSLSVSVPIFYSENFLKEIFPIVDKIYVMAYGTTNPYKVAGWIKKENEIDKNKVVVALRVKDFNSQYEIENFIEKLNEITGCNHFAFHSLKSFIEILRENL
jgi:hypothetical protein